MALDNDASNGGNAAHDLLRDQVFEHLLHLASRGEFLGVFAAPPCSIFSIARFAPHVEGHDGGPPPSELGNTFEASQSTLLNSASHYGRPTCSSTVRAPSPRQRPRQAQNGRWRIRATVVYLSHTAAVETCTRTRGMGKFGKCRR